MPDPVGESAGQVGGGLQGRGLQGHQPPEGRDGRSAQLDLRVEGNLGQQLPPDAKAPGGGWNQFEVGFCAFVGCAALASDYYYVLPHKKAISGTVYSGATDANGNRLGVGGVVIKLSGQSSGTAVTNKDGFYDALVDPGRYTVHMQSVGGHNYVSNGNVA
jgi:hypothetical protein